MHSKTLLGWIPILAFALACSKAKVDPTGDDLQIRFDHGTTYLEKKKYYRAQQEFEHVLLMGRHTELGDDAQFYLAEAYFLNGEYLLAINEYDRLVRQMTYSPFVEKSRFRICDSYAKKSPRFYHDQEYTEKAIQKLQEFVEDFPNSEYYVDVVKTIHSLRSKLARKQYESSILYIKMEAYDSAVNYLTDLLATYYDTPYADKARLKIVEAYLKAEKFEEAENFFAENESRFDNKNFLEEARALISEEKGMRD
ncbi:MAG: outer membrane protein assembly factor BamD [Candidatus Neomarinimicrobiota bacterium]